MGTSALRSGGSRGAVLGTCASLLLACAGPQRIVEGPPLDTVLMGGARVMWVGAHPDDESMAGAVLAKACIRLGNACSFFVFNHGDGGECCLPEGCEPDLASVRGRELAAVAERYRAVLEHHRYYNAPLPVESFPKRPEIEGIWLGQADPVGEVARAIRERKPDIVITFDPDHGFTGHPEHQAASRFAMLGARRAADSEARGAAYADLPPHRVRAIYHILNRHWLTGLALGKDPPPWTEEWDPDQACGHDDWGDKITCMDTMAEITRLHRTQENDMGGIRFVGKLIDTMYLRRVDPFDAEVTAWVAEIEAQEPGPHPPVPTRPADLAKPATPPATPAVAP